MKVAKKKKKSTRYIPTKNYVIAFLIAAAAIFLVFYIFEWYKVKQIEKYGTSYLIESNTVSMEIKNYKEIPIIFSEAPADYFVFINCLNEKENYKLEKELKKIIDDYDLNDIFYYMNVTKLKEKDANYAKKLNEAFDIDNKIKNAPTILYYNNNELVEVITSGKNEIISATELKRILDVYEIEKK